MGAVCTVCGVGGGGWEGRCVGGWGGGAFGLEVGRLGGGVALSASSFEQSSTPRAVDQGLLE